MHSAVHRRFVGLISSLILVFVVGWGSVSSAQSLSFPVPSHNYHRIIVKFEEGSAVRLRSDGLRSLNNTNINAAFAALRAPDVISVSRLFTQSESELDVLRLNQQQRATTTLADLNLYYVVRLDERTSDADAQAYIDNLNQLTGVQTAYATPLPAPLPSQVTRTASPDFSVSQGYLQPAPYGINRAAAAGLPGGLGDTVTFVDIEYMWNYDHEDYNLDASDLLTGDLYTTFGFDHGTAVMGQVMALDNGFGVTGLTPNADAKVASPIFGEDYNIAQTLLNLTPMLNAGDVVLIEQQAYPPFNINNACKSTIGCYFYVPVEIYQDTFDSIQYMVAAGIVVIEAAGNGGYDLDHRVFQNLFDRSVRDSGAILVGAADPTMHKDYFWSNVGSRVDVYGWGGEIYTTGYGDAHTNGVDFNQDYTAEFGGTSGASPIVTGAAIALQGIAKAKGDLLTPHEIRMFLRSTGTPHHAQSYLIGAMPDLDYALTNYLYGQEFFLSNRGFEDGTTSWTVVATKRDKVMCKAANVSVGACSFGFSGNIGENSRLTQTVDLSAAGLGAGDTLHLLYRLKANTGVQRGMAKFTITYAGGINFTSKAKFMSTGGLFVPQSIAVPLQYPVDSVKVDFTYRGVTGRAWLDEVRLCAESGFASCS